MRNVLPYLVGTFIGFSGESNEDIPSYKIIYSNQIENINTQNIPNKTKSIENVFDLELIPKISGNETSGTGYIYEQKKGIEDYIDNVYSKIEVPEIIPKEMIKAMDRFESNGDNFAISYKDARGRVQVTRGAWEQVDNSNFDEYWFIPQKNIENGIRYLVWVNDYWNENYHGWGKLTAEKQRELILAGYQAGVHKIEHRKFKFPSVTKRYITNVTNQMKIYEAEEQKQEEFKEYSIFRADF